jgi:hypothetical protein
MESLSLPSISTKSPNFTPEELAVLVDLYQKHHATLQGQFEGTSGAQRKKKIWASILESVVAVSGHTRTLDQIKKKVKNLKSATKLVASDNKRAKVKTGGGSDEETPLNELEEKLLSTISPRQITGILGGIDIHQSGEPYKLH